MNPLYLRITHANIYIEEINENKYLTIYNDVFNGIMGKIKEVSNDECDYEKDYMKIKFNFDDNLSLNKPLKFDNVTITIRFAFKKDGKLYLQVFLDDALYELSTKNVNSKQRTKMLEYDQIDISEGIDVNKTNLSKECDICHYCILKTLVLSMKSILVMAVLIMLLLYML